MIELTLRHLWTSTAEPITWQVDEQDERELRELLPRLNEWSAPRDSRTAVLLADEEDGSEIGAWSREGTSHLCDMIDADTNRAAGLMEIRHALRNGVTGP